MRRNYNIYDGNVRLNSVNQVVAHDSRSEKYAFIPTARVLDVLKTEGWTPTFAQESRANKEENKGFQKHLIRLRPNNLQNQVVGDVFPEIVLTNSHDGKASFQIMAGLFRLACSNGMVVSEGSFASHRIKHIGYQDEHVSNAISSIVENIPAIMNKMQEFKGISLSQDEKVAFGNSALILRFDEEQMEEMNKPATLNRLLTPLRMQDREDNLWNVFNRVQESFIKGGYFAVDKDRSYAKKKVRATTSIKENIRLNQSLWALTEHMATLKK